MPSPPIPGQETERASPRRPSARRRMLRVLAGLVVAGLGLGGLVWFVNHPPEPDDSTLSNLNQLSGVLSGVIALAGLWVAIMTLRRTPPLPDARPEDPALTPEAIRPVPGWPLAEVRDPFHFGLEVHHAIDSPLPDASPLPVYVRRAHDEALSEVVGRAAEGVSGIAVLVGGSSTGKTRACWEALEVLRGQDRPWRLWHPIDPTRPDAALAELADIAPYTVVWLNEAQFYLAPDKLGEQVAAGLRELMRDERRRPVLVLATLWPGEWDILTTRPAGGRDSHAQARELLDGHNIRVPDAFIAADLSVLADQTAADPRLTEAAERAEDGRITQYLAGVPVLLDRYEQAPPATKALIHAAMDARRLGAGPYLPQALLAQAAPGYLTDTEWGHIGEDEDWLRQALDYATTPCNGIPGILTPVRPRIHHDQRVRAASGPMYRLADYLDQYGRRHRAGQIPPIEFWDAAIAHAHPDGLALLGYSARTRGLYRTAAQLLKIATTNGDPTAATVLVHHLHTLHPGDHRPARWAVTYAALADPYAVTRLLAELREVGADDQVAALLARDPATHVTLDNRTWAVTELLNKLREVRAHDQLAALAERAIAHVALDDPYAVTRLLAELREVGADEQFATLAERAIAHVALDDPYAVTKLLGELRRVGADDQVTALAEHAAAHIALDNLYAVTRLLAELRKIGADDQLAALLARDPATHVTLDNPWAVAELLAELRKIGADDQLAALLARDPATHVTLGGLPDGVTRLLAELREVGADEQLAALAERAAAHTALDLTGLLYWLREARADDKLAALAKRAAAHTALHDPGLVAELLDRLRKVGADDQVTALLARDPATHVTLDNPWAVAKLLDELLEAGADDQLTALAKRATTHVALDDPWAVAELLDRLRKVGADDQVTALLARDPATHVTLDDPWAVAELLDELRKAGADDQVTALLARDPATHITLDDPEDVIDLLDKLREVEAHDQLAALAERAATHVALDNLNVVTDLLDKLRKEEAHDQLVTLAKRAATHVALDDLRVVIELLYWLRKAGADDQLAALAERTAAHTALNDPGSMAELLNRFREAGADEQVTALAEHATAHVALDDSYAVARLLGELRKAGADDQLAALAERAATHVALDGRYAVAGLLGELRKAGANEQVTTLVGRLPGAGLFEEFLEAVDRRERFKFGREPDGSAAPPWGWDDLG
ncbi:hypothetical protein [Spongiactinospora sp. 9N601]|uniref:hypothetical protein n=1 Tax=Spongiactinospora sp. 9N601 TaxID=3375149 RepID=UPI0037B6A564